MQNKKKSTEPRIAIIAPSFSDGGAERVMSYLVNHSKKFQPYSLTDRLDYLSKPQECRIANAYFSSKLLKRLHRALFVFQIIKQHRIVITCSYELFIIIGLAALVMRGKIIIFRPSIDLDYIKTEVTHRFKPVSGLILRMIDYLTRQSLIVYQSSSIERSFETLRPKSAISLPNPVEFDESSLRIFKRDMSTGINLIFAGRLTKEKGFDRFLRCHQASKRSAEANWLCYGTGPMAEKAEARAYETTNFHALGWQNRSSFVSVNSIMVVPSRIEGAPNIVLEALMAGWPVIASKEVHDIFSDDPIIRDTLYTFDFEDNDDIIPIAWQAFRHYNFEDHLAAISDMKRNRNISAYIKSITMFAHQYDTI